MNSGTKIIVPAIADFEVRRELTRTHSVNSLAELDKFNAAVTDRYLALTDSALKRAAAMWAVARNRGTLPADPKELNGDVLIAAQVLDYQQIYGLSTVDIVIATINTGHLSLFVPAAVWSNILP
jgi:hypothetical protein